MKGAAGIFVVLAACNATEGVRSDPRAEACGACHTTQLEAWQGSRHATSAGSPVLAALLPRVEASWGETARARCVGCHAPKHGGDSGIGCVACHAAIGNAEERDGKLLVDLGAPISGPFGDALATPAHGSRASELLTSPILCGTCHEVSGPALFVEPTLTEHRASPAARAGLTCAGCHMPETGAGAIASGAYPVRRRVDHAFAGIDPPWGAPPDEAARAAEATRKLLASALSLGVRADGGGVSVTLASGFMGHTVPSGAAFLREIWVDVDYVGADGIAARAPAVIVLGSRPTKNGAPVALPTDADAVEARVLPPGEKVEAHVDLPAGARGVTATLRARAVRQEILDALDLGARSAEVPTHDVLSAHLP